MQTHLQTMTTRYLPVQWAARHLLVVAAAITLVAVLAVVASADGDPGSDTDGVGTHNDWVPLGSILPQVTETGFISASIDGLGTNLPAGTITIIKPAGATVRSAYFAAASTGFSLRKLNNTDVQIDGANVAWDLETPSSISSWNHWSNVTGMVKAKIDAAAAGPVSFRITEVSTFGIDGEILAVIFDDPNQTTSNTVILLWGAQDIAGDTFNIGLASPIDLSDANFALDMSLGISFGFQGSVQVSLVDVNGTRMTSSAGGQDDGVGAIGNGALLTVGGVGDTNANPPPFAGPGGNHRFDDELYNLLPFVANGDMSITVDTINPSNDDNIFFAALLVTSATAIVGEGILLAPAIATNDIGDTHTLTASVQDDNGDPVVGRDVKFVVVAGPHATTMGTVATNAGGVATFSYVGTTVGIDTIEASFVDSTGTTQTSNQVRKEWVPRTVDCLNEVTWVPVAGSFVSDPTAVPFGPAGTFTFDAKMTNVGVDDLTDLAAPVVTLSPDNRILNYPESPATVGDVLTLPLIDGYADSVLSPGEMATFTFVVGLDPKAPFSFFVDLECKPRRVLDNNHVLEE